jgi:hypothetical protein
MRLPKRTEECPHVNVLSNTSPLVLVTGSVLAVLATAFVAAFLFPAAMQWMRLRAIQARIRAFDGKNPAADFKRAFAGDARLAHLWQEYQDSLHLQRDADSVVVRVRATVPAHTCFNEQSVVDARLRTEFFKHLPGLFTGVGIIGTFTGLIEGLRQFQVSEDALAVRSSLEALMHHVGEAFLVSASAITAAMVVTFLEKLMLASLYRRTQDIAQSIDTRFDAGAGEDYLQRLVQSSEASAVQSRALHGALVSELGKVLREFAGAHTEAAQAQQRQFFEQFAQVSTQQLEAIRDDQRRLHGDVSRSLQLSLQAPLQELARTVRAGAGRAEDDSAQALRDAMAGFARELSAPLTEQTAALAELNRQTARGIHDAAMTLASVATNAREDARRAGTAVDERLAAAAGAWQRQQQALGDQCHAMLAQMRDVLAASQTAAEDRLRNGLDHVGAQVGHLLAQLRASQLDAADTQRSREQSLAQQAGNAVEGMSAAVRAAGSDIASAAALMARSAAAMTESTAASVAQVGQGAQTLREAARDFAACADRVGGVMDRAAGVATQLGASAHAVGDAAAAMQDIAHNHRGAGEAVALTVSELRATVESARREASLTADVLARIQGCTERLAGAQRQADDYLASVSQVLGQAHQAFAVEVQKTLDTANSAFHTKLTTAVGLLSGAIEELELTLSTAVTPALVAH